MWPWPWRALAGATPISGCAGRLVTTWPRPAAALRKRPPSMRREQAPGPCQRLDHHGRLRPRLVRLAEAGRRSLCPRDVTKEKTQKRRGLGAAIKDVDMSYTEIYRHVKKIGLEPLTWKNRRNWWTCMVVAMVHSPGTVPEIEARAQDVARVLNLDISSRGKPGTLTKGGFPCFHLGLSGVRDYFLGDRGPNVGNKSFNEISPHCAKHSEYSWRELIHQATCNPHCRYGLRIRGR